MSDLGKLGGFVSHYANELLTISGTIGTLLGALPIDHEDRANIQEKLDVLNKAAEAASAGAGALVSDVRKIVVKASDVNAAVAAYLESPKGAAALAKALKGATK